MQEQLRKSVIFRKSVVIVNDKLQYGNPFWCWVDTCSNSVKPYSHGGAQRPAAHLLSAQVLTENGAPLSLVQTINVY